MAGSNKVEKALSEFWWSWAQRSLPFWRRCTVWQFAINDHL